jgi:hypothetical protein
MFCNRAPLILDRWSSNLHNGSDILYSSHDLSLSSILRRVRRVRTKFDWSVEAPVAVMATCHTAAETISKTIEARSTTDTYPRRPRRPRSCPRSTLLTIHTRSSSSREVSRRVHSGRRATVDRRTAASSTRPLHSTAATAPLYICCDCDCGGAMVVRHESTSPRSVGVAHEWYQ